jgi:murein DD-endopeptidase MepM/ murein hydrolase activator NlpD
LALVGGCLLLAFAAAAPVRATGTAQAACATPSPAPVSASGARTNAAPPSSSCVDPTVLQARQRLGVALANALVQEQQVAMALQVNVAEQQALLADIQASQARIEQLNQQIVDLEAQIADKTQQVEEERAQLAVLAKALYAQPSSLLVLVSQSSSLDDLLTRSSSLIEAGDRAHQAKIQLEADLIGLQGMRDSAAAARDAEQTNSDRLQSELVQLQDMQSQAEALESQLMDLITSLRAQLQAVGGGSPDLAAQILAGLNTAQLQGLGLASQQVWTQVQVWLQTHQLPTPAADHLQFAMPVAGAVLTQPFGPSPYAFEPAYGGYPHFHTGVDLAAPLDTPVVAAYAGIVALVGFDALGYGNYVVIGHGGKLTTLYGHLDKVLVSPGQTVSAGYPIGLEGTTGNSTGPHVHFEFRVGGVPQDPLPYLPAIPIA